MSAPSRIPVEEDPPSVSIDDVTVTEGNNGTASAVFTVSLSKWPTYAVSVDFTTADSTASLANGDYGATSGTLTLIESLSGTITVLVNGDATRELAEVFLVRLSNPSYAVIARGQGLGTIQNDDGMPSLSINDVTVTEGNSGARSAVFTVSLSNPIDQPVTVSFAAADSTARLANGDFQATSGTLTIPPKFDSGTITVAVNGDLIRESNETFRVNLGNPGNATITDFQGLGTILNDDGLPGLSINDVTVTEGNWS